MKLKLLKSTKSSSKTVVFIPILILKTIKKIINLKVKDKLNIRTKKLAKNSSHENCYRSITLHDFGAISHKAIKLNTSVSVKQHL